MPFQKVPKSDLNNLNSKLEIFTLTLTINQQPESNKSKQPQTTILSLLSILWRKTFMKVTKNVFISAVRVKISTT